MNPIIYLLDMILGLLNIVVVLWLIILFLLRLGILNNYNQVVQKIIQAISQLVEPMLRPIRRHVPCLGGIDISPLILMLLINFARYTLHYYFA